MIKCLINMFHVKHIADYLITSSFPLMLSPAHRAGTVEARADHRVFRSARGVLLAFLLMVAALGLGCTQVSKPSGWASPVPINDMLLISNKDGSVSAIRPPSGGGQASVVWTFPTD